MPAVLAAVLAMFSFESRPRPLPQGLAADVLFDGRLAAQSAAALAERHPNRRAGSVGDRATAATVARTFLRRGFVVESDHFGFAGKELVNVIARRAGRSRRQIVVVAARDASDVPDAPGSAADTAALLELARVLEGRASRKTVVLASIDGSTLGQAGAERLVGELGDPGLIDGVLVVSDLAAPQRRGSMLVPWSNSSSRAGIGLQRTVADSIRQEIQKPVGSTGAPGQLARLSFPIGIGAQGVLLERGYDAVRISGSGELPPEGSGALDQIDEDRLGGLGRGTLRALTAIDLGERPVHGPKSYVIAVSQVVPGWVIAFLALTLVLPGVVGAVDAFARARRRRLPVGPWFRFAALAAAPFLLALALAELLALVGVTPEPPPAPVAPEENPLDGAALGVLAGVAALLATTLFGVRAVVARTAVLRDPAQPGAACAIALVACAATIVLFFVNPYAALLAAPALHLWMLATLLEPPPGRRVRALLVAGGVLLPALVASYYCLRLSMDPLTGAWYLLMLVTGHAVGFITALIGCVFLGVLTAVVWILRARPDPPPEPPAPEAPRVYGPGRYAGPGSLGGTESALER